MKKTEKQVTKEYNILMKEFGKLEDDYSKNSIKIRNKIAKLQLQCKHNLVPYLFDKYYRCTICDLGVCKELKEK